MLLKSALQTGDQHDQTLKDALDAANRVILANPEKPDGYAIYGKVLDWQNQPDQALPQIQRALDFDRNYALGNSYLAETLVDLQRWEQAQTAIDLALAADPNNPDILRDYGYFLESQQDYVTAATQYESALTLQPNQPYIMLALAKVYRVTGRYDESLDQLFAIDTLSPKNALIQFEIGITYESFIGDPTSAQKFYEQATQADPNYALPWIRLGTIHYIQGSYQQAIPDFEQAIKLGVTDQALVYLRLALAYANQNRCDQAVVNLQKAEALVQPDDTETLDTIAQGYKQCPVVTPSPTRASP
jgi:tetratricopeptide (TPR) repeat protein